MAAVSNAGALGSIGAVFTPADALGQQLARVRELTDRAFAVNHVIPLLDEAAFALTLEAQSAAISFALADPGELVGRAHTVRQARAVVERGVDAIIAQGSEAGGQGPALGVGRG